ncbi:MAG: AI-2E family transporter [Candidatus Pacearchaeota archaeon]
MTSIILIALLVLSFFLLKPILLSIIVGVILSFIFYPVYLMINSKLKSPNLSAALICFFLILLIALPIWFFTPLVINESIKVFLASQKIDFISLLKDLSPSLFASEEFSAQIGSALSSFVTSSTNSLMNSLSEFILNFPTMFLQSLVVFFTFFYVLRDRNRIFAYMKSLSPFPPSVEKKFFDSSKSIANAVIYGQVIIGIIQGLVLGIGLFIFRVPNSLILTLLATLAGIFPIIGTAIVWVPVAIYLFLIGNTFSFFGVVIFGIVSSSIDNLLRPIIVSRRANIDPLLILIGMIGGLFLFGILGFILGPLILAYLVIILELYRNKNISNVLVQEDIIESSKK